MSDNFRANVLIYGGMASLAVILCVAASNPQIPLWLGILVAVAIGASLIVSGMGIQSGTKHSGESRAFWPTPAEAWGMLGLLVHCVAILVPVVFFLPLFWLAGGGDNWSIVALRIAWVALAIGASRWWFGIAGVNTGARVNPSKMAGSVRKAAVTNWELLVVSAIVFLLAYFFAYLNNPEPIRADGPQRQRGVAVMLEWCHRNPNTAVSSSLVVGVFTLSLYVYRLIETSTRSSHIDTH
jgi:uncharacterized integral membrane protein